MTDEIMEQLAEVLSLYSYDYVINELSDGDLDAEDIDVGMLVGT